MERQTLPSTPAPATAPLPGARTPGSPRLDRAALLPALLALLFLVAALVATADIGLTTDERLHQEHGLRLWNFYSSFGRDLAVLQLRDLAFYGGLFDLTGFVVARLLGSTDPLVVRHVLCAACGTIGVLFTTLLATRLADRRAGFLAGLLLVATPRWFGNALFDSKDIPFAAGYVVALYALVRLAEVLPRPSAFDWLRFALAAGLAMSVRIGGFFLIGLAALLLVAAPLLTTDRSASIAARARATVRPAAAWAGAAALSYGIALLSWPYLLQAPIGHLDDVLRMASRFHWDGLQLFRGAFLSVPEIGRAYLPTWFFVTTPPVVLVGLGLAAWTLGREAFAPPAVRAAARRDPARPLKLVALLLATFIPPAIAFAGRSVLYDGIRHFLFIVPGLCILAALGWSALLSRLRPGGGAAYAAAGLLALGVLEPAIWLVRSHPYQYAYFGPQAGGFARATHSFGADYWFVSSRAAARELDRLATELPSGRRLAVSCQNLFLIKPQLAPASLEKLALTPANQPIAADLEVLFYDKLLRRGVDPKKGLIYEERLVDGQVPFFVIRRLDGALSSAAREDVAR